MSEGIDDNKANGMRKYWYFLQISFRFQPKICVACHDLVQQTMSFNDVANISVRGDNYRILFLHISKDEAITLLRNADLTEKSGA